MKPIDMTCPENRVSPLDSFRARAPFRTCARHCNSVGAQAHCHESSLPQLRKGANGNCKRTHRYRSAASFQLERKRISRALRQWEALRSADGEYPVWMVERLKQRIKDRSVTYQGRTAALPVAAISRCFQRGEYLSWNDAVLNFQAEVAENMRRRAGTT
jgi:hypothetical protein